MASLLDNGASALIVAIAGTSSFQPLHDYQPHIARLFPRFPRVCFPRRTLFNARPLYVAGSRLCPLSPKWGRLLFGCASCNPGLRLFSPCGGVRPVRSLQSSLTPNRLTMASAGTLADYAISNAFNKYGSGSGCRAYHWR